jgi:hypothetical protein
VAEDPIVKSIMHDNEICDGGSTILHSIVTGGTGTTMYQWQTLAGPTWTNIAGANGPNYSTGILNTGSYSYRVIVTQGTGCESMSDGETIVVNPDPVVTDNADDNEFCEGGTTTIHNVY